MVTLEAGTDIPMSIERVMWQSGPHMCVVIDGLPFRTEVTI